VQVWTIQLARAKAAAKLGVPVLNTTVKCGDLTFAPTWEIVMDVKHGRISQETYTERYTQLMRESYKRYRAAWLEVADMPTVAIACMCPPGKFCHRHLLADMFKAVCLKTGRNCILRGEWTDTFPAEKCEPLGKEKRST
jgi:uncharacterized protein YeaO (DUF488 family)